MPCTYPLTEDGERCGEEVIYGFTPEIEFCKKHCRETYNKFEEKNRQLVWYLDLRDILSGH